MTAITPINHSIVARLRESLTAQHSRYMGFHTPISDIVIDYRHVLPDLSLIYCLFDTIYGRLVFVIRISSNVRFLIRDMGRVCIYVNYLLCAPWAIILEFLNR